MGVEDNLKYYSSSFITNKLRADDYELLIERGFTRCGTYMYCRSVTKSCCEVFQYKVRVDDYVVTKNQQ